jgi:thiamine pyrophosphate-dependent acetolactate synthase large subunit-like protein
VFARAAGLPMEQDLARAAELLNSGKKVCLLAGQGALGAEVGLVGDSRRTLQALLPLLRRQQRRSFLERAQEGMRDWWSSWKRGERARIGP